MGDDSPWFASEIPTVFISQANPYHLLDVPMVHTYVNVYTNNEFVLESLMHKIMGRSEFKGKSPVDAFCGREDTRY
jgi:beta-N-acetylhexosaminidase